MTQTYNLVLNRQTKTLKRLLCAGMAMLGSSIIVSVIGISEVGAVPITHQVTIQPIQVRNDDGSNPANINRQLFELETDKIWAQAGIDILFLKEDWKTLNVTNLQTAFLTDDPNDLDGTARYSRFPNNGGSNDPTVINMWFVDEIIDVDDNDAPFFGLGNPFNGSVLISDSVFDENRIDTIAHEIGHVLGLDHTNEDSDPNNDDDPENLLTRGQERLIPSSLDDISPMGDLDNLTEEQLEIVMLSPAVKPVPVPAAWLLFTTGSLLMGSLASIRRRRENSIERMT